MKTKKLTTKQDIVRVIEECAENVAGGSLTLFDREIDITAEPHWSDDAEEDDDADGVILTLDGGDVTPVNVEPTGAIKIVAVVVPVKSLERSGGVHHELGEVG
jgi:hypothetical protein